MTAASPQLQVLIHFLSVLSGKYRHSVRYYCYVFSNWTLQLFPNTAGKKRYLGTIYTNKPTISVHCFLPWSWECVL